MRETLVGFIKTHALAHYEDGGWDVIVEAWSDNEIEAHLISNNAITQQDALDAFAFYVDVMADRQAEARYQGQQ